MKNQRKSPTLKTVLILFFLLAGAMSCDQTKNSSQTTNAAATESKPKPPKEDMHTAITNGNLDVIKQHIAAGSNLNEKDPFGGSSPLTSAALFGELEIAKVLIEAGADINFKNNEGSTPLHIAAFFCNTEIVKLLLDNGADKTITNNFGATALASVSTPFSEVENVYHLMSKQLAPLGLKMDMEHIENTRPQVAELLK